MFIQDSGSQFSFVVSLSAFGMKLSSQNEFRSFLFSSVFWQTLRRIYINLSLNVWRNSYLKPCDPGLLFVESCLLLQFNYQELACSDFLYLPDSVSGDCIFLGIQPFGLGCPILWYVIFHNNLLQFVFLWYQLNSPATFLMLSPFFSLMNLARGLSILFLLKEPTHSFIDPFYFLQSLFLLFRIFIFFPLLISGFVSSSFRCRVRLF